MHDSALSDSERERLHSAANDVARRAYAPYSNFQVGAAVLTVMGNVISGCNVENASYGLTTCAERSAIFAAVAQEGASEFRLRAIAVDTAHGAPAAPCGACRQVILEFNPDAEVMFRSQSGIEIVSARDLLPHAFSLD